MSNANVIFRMMVNKYGLDNLGIQNVYTPVNKIEEATGIKFFDFINSETRSLGVLFNWEFIYTMLEEAVKNNYTDNIKFTYFYDSEADKNALNFNGFDKYRFAKVNFEIEFVNISEFTEQNKDVKVIEKAMAGKHFDIVFSNPPYNNNIDLKILQTMFDHSDKIIFIHPSTFLLDKKFKTKLYNDIRNTNYLEKTIFVWGNMLFDIWLFCPLTISVWNKDHGSNIVEVIDTAITNSSYTCDVNDISVHGKYFQKIKRFLNCKSNLQNNITDENELTDYSVKFALIRGHANIKNNISGYNEDFFTIAAIDNELNKCDHMFRFPAHVGKTHRLHYGFSSEDERENFLGYCKTKIVRFLLSLVKTNAHLDNGELETIPWLDFTQEWNDAKLCKEFGIDKELWLYIDKFIPDYYEDYESGFESKTLVSRHYAVMPNDEIMKFCPKDVLDYIISAEITNDIFISKSFRHVVNRDKNCYFQVYKFKTKTPGIYAWSLVKHMINKNFYS